MDTFAQDIRLALRQLLRHRSWTLVAGITLALGIGANSSVFTLINTTLFKPMDVPDAGRLVWVTQRTARGGQYRNLSYPAFQEFQARQDVFTGVAAFSNTSLAMGGTTPERVNGLMVSANLFDVLQLRPLAGRSFLPAEDSAGAVTPVVIISEALWRRRFGAAPGIINATILINGQNFTVVGVAPAGFKGIGLTDPADLFIPIAMNRLVNPGMPDLLTNPRAIWLRSLARLQPGVSAARATAALGIVNKQQEAALRPDPDNRLVAEAVPMAGGLDPSSRREVLPVFSLLMVVPVLVLVVACANVASLLLARGATRRREFAVRRAVGASRGRLVRQLLTEALVLAVLAGLLGVLLSTWLSALIVRLGNIPAAITTALVPDGRVLAFTTAVALLTTILFGLLPALSASSPSVVPGLKDEGGGITVARRRHRLRDAFIVAQVAVSLLLLITAGLFLRSLDKALHVDPGFAPSHLGTVSFDVGLQRYSADRAANFYRQLREEVDAMPGVESSALVTSLPLGGVTYGSDILPEGATGDARRLGASFTATLPGYFGTMGIPLVAGRDFDANDQPGSALVVIVNQTLARQFWPGLDPIGKRMRLMAQTEGPLLTVVGVARDGKYRDLTESPQPFYYLPQPQELEFGTGISLVVRSTGSIDPVLRALPKIFATLDPDLPLARVASYADLLRDRMDKQSAASAALGVFGLLAMLLAALGLYGITTYGVAARTREIGIRMSLGARGGRVLGLFVGEGLRLAGVGVGIGLLLSAAASKLLAGFLFGLSAMDGLTFAGGAVVLVVVAAVASYLPARRATRVDPMAALRSD